MSEVLIIRAFCLLLAHLQDMDGLSHYDFSDGKICHSCFDLLFLLKFCERAEHYQIIMSVFMLYWILVRMLGERLITRYTTLLPENIQIGELLLTASYCGGVKPWLG